MEVSMTERPGYDQEQEKKTLSPALENYLEIIFLEEARDGAARASSIADAAKVSRSTVTSTLKTLKSMGLVEYEPYSLVHLTKEGRVIGRDITHRHVIFREFFEQVLQLDHEEADAVACELEHVVPAPVIRRWGQFGSLPVQPGLLEELAGGLPRRAEKPHRHHGRNLPQHGLSRQSGRSEGTGPKVSLKTNEH